MDKINLVIADLQLVLVLLEAEQKDDKRIKATLKQASSDLNAAIKSIVGENFGGGET